MEENILKEIPQMGLIAGVIYMLIKWLMGNLSNQLAEIIRAQQIFSLTQAEVLKLILLHDATVRGVNPSTGEDLGDSHRQAVEVYEKIKTSVDNLEQQIKSQLIK